MSSLSGRLPVEPEGLLPWNIQTYVRLMHVTWLDNPWKSLVELTCYL